MNKAREAKPTDAPSVDKAPENSDLDFSTDI